MKIGNPLKIRDHLNHDDRASIGATRNIEVLPFPREGRGNLIDKYHGNKEKGIFIALIIIGFFMMGFMVVSPAAALLASPSLPPGVTTRCTDCHDDYVFKVKYADSVHSDNGCRSCHRGIQNMGRHIRGEEKAPAVDCAICHKEAAAQHVESVHAGRANLQCQDCHRGIHSLQAKEEPLKVAVIENCIQCHDRERYVADGHGAAVLRGNRDAAACNACHGIHHVRDYQGGAQGDLGAAREKYTQKCLTCHEDPVIMKRHGVSLSAAANYGETYHGKIRRIGDPHRVAGCADCHNGHNILPKEDPRSTVHPQNLVRDCQVCHTGFHLRFVKFIAHPDHKDRSSYPILYWTNILMIGLLVSVFAFFWVHTALWWRRVYWDLCRLRKAGVSAKTLLPNCEDGQYVQRFSPKERIMHLLLILSFFTLVMTGFPLKYHDVAWSRVMINLWGGPMQAGIYHRAAALLLSALFLYTLWLSLKFLFPKGIGRVGWISRLLGPDSLCPNLKDWADMKGMFRWFFNRGDMPKFERWTYWEKFDFLAVFWGMFAIGLSGLILWFPELFSYIMPGWMINVAAVVHSEEAFLAAIFIFTVHFFNNHFVPNKFPLEPNIFTGRYTVEALQHERPMEYDRIIAEERLEGIKREGPGLWMQLFASMVGLGSLLLGLLLTVLIFWAALFY